MFAYCYNNPISYVDYNGESPLIILGAIAYSALKALAVASGIIIASYVVAVGVTILVEVGENIADYINTANDQTTDPPQSIIAPEGAKEVDENGNPVVHPKEEPTDKEGYIAPKKGSEWVKDKKTGKYGWKDKHGNIWVPVPTGSKDAHGGGHWDVQRPDGKGYVNVYPGGRKHYSSHCGKIPIF